MGILKWLCENLHRQRAELKPNDWIFHHDNAPAHKSLSAKHFLNQLLKWNTYPITLIWLQMTSGHFQNIRSELKGRVFQDIEDMKKKCDDGSTDMPSIKSFQELHNHTSYCSTE
jgi:hypothetical protein